MTISGRCYVLDRKSREMLYEGWFEYERPDGADDSTLTIPGLPLDVAGPAWRQRTELELLATEGLFCPFVVSAISPAIELETLSALRPVEE